MSVVFGFIFLFSKAGSEVLYKHVPAFAYSPRCAAGFPLLSGLGGQFLPKFQVAWRRGNFGSFNGFLQPIRYPVFGPYQILELFRTVLNSQKA